MLCRFSLAHKKSANVGEGNLLDLLHRVTCRGKSFRQFIEELRRRRALYSSDLLLAERGGNFAFLLLLTSSDSEFLGDMVLY